jgi:hypothetical protein
MRRSAAIVVVMVLLTITGCASTSAPAPSSPQALASPAIARFAPTSTGTPKPTATATPKPTPTATPERTTTPTAEPIASIDPSAGLRIAAPYKLGTLDPITKAAYEAAMGKALGSLGSVVSIGLKQVTQAGLPAGFVMVIAFNNASVSHTTGFLDAVAGGSAASLGGKLGKKTMLGTQVRYASSATGAFAAYQRGEAVVYVIVPTTKSALDVISAIIKASR